MWQVKIYGRILDIEYLDQHFTTTSSRIVKDTSSEGYLYESDNFKNCSTSTCVLEVAKKELLILSGALKLFNNSPEQLHPGAVYQSNTNGNRHIFVQFNEKVSLTDCFNLSIAPLKDIDGNVTEQPIPESKIDAFFNHALSLNDTTAEKVLRLLLRPDFESWTGMYRMHEVIEYDVGGSTKIKKKPWCSSIDYERFKHSANSVDVGGDDSRHGKNNIQPPQNPMTLDDASVYLNSILLAWIAEKGV